MPSAPAYIGTISTRGSSAATSGTCCRRSGARDITRRSSSTLPSQPWSPDLKDSTSAVWVLVASRAALTWPLSTTSVPIPRASGATHTRAAFSRLRGPSESGNEALRWAPVNTTGLAEAIVRSRNQAVSSSVSVPCETIAPAISSRASAADTAWCKASQRDGPM